MLFFRTTIFLCRFVKSLLSKGQSTVLDMWWQQLIKDIWHDSNIQYELEYSTTFSWAGEVKFQSYFYVQISSYTWYIRFLIDWVEVYSQWYSTWNYYTISYTHNVVSWWEHTATFKVCGGRSGSYNYAAFDFSYQNCYWYIYFTPKVLNTPWVWIPFETKAIWNLSWINLFWKNLTNSSYKEFFAWLETNTATVWSITPWNFVGYLKIWDYKIPYYK